MTQWTVVGDAEGNATSKACHHLSRVNDVEPSVQHACEDCLREGTRWVHLRMCLECGHMGCCDNSPRRHATAHWRAVDHVLVRSMEPDDSWAWCYADELFLLPEGSA